MKALFLRNEIPVTKLLSSTTYRINSFDRCVYCHKNVENDYWDYNGEWYQPYRCDCKKAIEELKAKETLLDTLAELQKDIDVEEINEVTKESIVNELNRGLMKKRMKRY